jgi:CRISPR/Cas system CMR subunit Cmr4 (Cas7 group RAMP superfamily)
MPQYTFSVKLYLCAPILSQATGGRKHGIDTVMLRNSANNPCLLGSSIRGNLRHAWKQFKEFGLDKEQVDQWLGPEPPKEDTQ